MPVEYGARPCPAATERESLHVHEFVIIGAGFAGAATAWHLRRAAVDDVVILEREATPGVHSSGRNACLVREHVRDETWAPLTSAGAAFLRRGELATYDRHGSLLIGLGDEDVSRRVPRARGRGLWCPEDGIVDVAQLLDSYLRGIAVRFGCALERFERDGDALRLTTSDGPLYARTLVNAAGPWAGRIGGLPLTPFNRHVFVTEPMADVAASWPFVWDVDHGLYFRPESGGLLLSPCDETPAAPGAYAEDGAQLERLAELVATYQPGLGDLRIAHRWVGQRTFAEDRAPVIGYDPRESRLFHVAGLGGHGVTSSWAVGRLAARLLLDPGRAPAGVDPARLAPAP